MRRRTLAHTPAPLEEGPLSRWTRTGRGYFQRWLLIGALIGVVAGVGAIFFYSAIAFCTHLFLELGAGYTPPKPAGEGSTVIQHIARPWMLPVVTTLGGLLCGLIVFTFAPEAEGHGTDAAIDAFHRHDGKIRSRIPPIKLIASAITIGSGGSAGREGPMAQIAAGFGSWLGDLLHLDDHDRRIAMAAGVGAGIGSIFKAPFGGALLSGEILYKRDFEAEALFPAFIASVVGFSIYGLWSGWTPIFGSGGHFTFTNPLSLLGFLLLGIICGLVGLIYPKTLYGLRDLFHAMKIPNQLKPAIGGLLVGMIGLVFPQSLGMGYGFAQFAINGDFVVMSAWLMLALVFVKIVTTALTIGSGGSGGVFGPGMVVGSFLGAATWSALHAWTPWMLGSTPPGAFAVVGMGAFFGGIGKAPLAVILMVAEMTGEYTLIVPAMLATMVAYLVTGDTSIYESQVDTRLDSRAHKDDYALPLLQSMTVRQALEPGRATAGPDMTVAGLTRLLREHEVASVPIVEDGRLIGLVTTTDIARIPAQRAGVTRARQIMSRRVVRAYLDESLYDAWLRMTQRGLRQLAVVERTDAYQVVGMVTLKAIGRLLRQPIISSAIAASMTTSGATPDTSSHLALSQGYPSPTIEPPDMDVEQHEQEIENGVTPAPPSRTEPAASNPLEEAAWRRAAQSRAAQDPLVDITVAEAMLRTPRLISETEPLVNVRAQLDERGRALIVVNADGDLAGIVTRSDLRDRSPVEDGKSLTAGDVAVRRLVTAQPDETLRVAVRRMSRLGLRQLPVVPKDTLRPAGLLRRSDILEAYGRALNEEQVGPRSAS
ncbi:MAG TPA: chloride channel protein [Ktedonobacterales bacterium]|nr:chloride channel protein [Ktedonobacterales bacterium]